MEISWIAQAETTVQVTEDTYKRKIKTLILKPETTVAQIVNHFDKLKVDMGAGITLIEAITQP